MANTVIQLKRSTTAATPSTLNIAEPAYSYSSNTLFIGAPGGGGVLQIGGYTRDQLLTYSAKHANLAFDQANSEVSTAAFGHANAGFDHANAAFDSSNTKLSSSGGTISGALTVTQNVTISGNLTVQGNTTTVDTTNILIADNILTLNSAIDQASAPIKDAGLEIDRGSSANVLFKFSETADHWQFTNDGTNYENVASESAESYANSAFIHANAAFTAGNTNATSAATAQTHAEQAFDAANTAQTHAEDAFDKANTDATGISITSIHVGEADKVSAFHVAANGRIISANSTSIALAASAITSGTLGVARGGTGAATHTTNGVLLGQGTSAFTTASSSTEGHLLTINDSGVPTFSHLSGGEF